MSKFKEVSILGITYSTVTEAAKHIGLTVEKVYSRLNSKAPEWCDWFFIEEIVSDAKTRYKPVINCTYKLVHIPSGKFYVGSTKDPYGRKAAHLWRLRNNRHYCKKLQELWTVDNSESNWRWEHTLFNTRDEAYIHEQSILNENIHGEYILNTVFDAKSPMATLMYNPEYMAIVRQKKIDKYSSYSTEERKALSEKMSICILKRWNSGDRRQKWSGGGNPFAKKVMINGVVYESVKDAQRELCINEKTIRTRARSNTHPNYTFDVPVDDQAS